MGTGLGAVGEGSAAARMLQGMLCAGFPAEHALESVNSLCALRGQAGAVTMDLAEIMLDSGRVTVYKWGAPPSFLVTALGAEKIGTAGPPPGLSVTDRLESVERLSLRRRELLVLTSDGAGGEEALHGVTSATEPGEIGRRLVEAVSDERTDDATAVTIRLTSA
jgi:serine phosphatase RsbU (regulator of sigma subunit)